MARSRKQAWLRDELILALDLYHREGRNPPAAEGEKVSVALRAIPVEQHLTEDPSFRNPNSVHLKVYNFVAIDPESETSGMSRGGKGDQEVWDDFAGDPSRLAAAAAAIRANLQALTPDEAGQPDTDIEDAPEGRLLTRVHVIRERSPKLVAAKKAATLAAHGKLSCEACGFDFAAAYGERGEGFAKCHHTLPVSKLEKGADETA